MTIAAGMEAGLTILDLFDRLAAIIQQRQAAQAAVAVSQSAADAAEARSRMELAHQNELAIHAQIQALRNGGGA